MLQSLLTIATIATAAATTSKVFAGNFSDPNHPGCARTITTNGMTGSVFGSDAAGGEGAACDGKTDVRWGPLKAVFEIDPPPETGAKINVDFSSKGGPPQLTGEWNASALAINWADGNSWTAVKCSATEYCCPDAKHCLTPSTVQCQTDSDCTRGAPTCCPLLKICVAVGVPCVSPCADQNSYCCPDAKHCLTAVSNKFCHGSSTNCATGEVCCPVTDLCVTVGAACVPSFMDLIGI